ncbi:hypothetical protein [Thermoactinomyces sp. DSM 45892]|uniref:hypothetical protein n=1 Tax=Thermoactinomyces sp. DSM 45892 TaxID=1882753 RepID=UPI00089BFBD4|nr:hypothetical protein [Thermoactinomyces sp. DSM 45892]SDY85754.1 hypothetical protein SAMN05444416_10989 [Thermoactinomyces sp. DSM 45892]
MEQAENDLVVFDPEVTESIQQYKQSFTKKMILHKWKRIGKRTRAAYQLPTAEKRRLLEDAYTDLKELIYDSYYEDFDKERTEVQLCGWFGHCGWVSNQLERRPDMVSWLELQQLFIQLEAENLLQIDERGCLV